MTILNQTHLFNQSTKFTPNHIKLFWDVWNNVRNVFWFILEEKNFPVEPNPKTLFGHVFDLRELSSFRRSPAGGW